MTEAEPTGEPAFGVYKLKPTLLVVLTIMGVFTAAISIRTGIRTGNQVIASMWAALGVFWVALFFAARRNRTVVDLEGVHVWRLWRWQTVTWNQVDRLAAVRPFPGSPTVITIHARTGRTVTTDIPDRLRPALDQYGTDRRANGE